jgi:hypothetical protein
MGDTLMRTPRRLCTHLRPEHTTLDTYVVSNSCEVCGGMSEQYRVGNLSNGIVTYAIRTCDPCFNGGS